MTDLLEELAADDESALQSIVWMAEETGLILPPLPESYLERLQEVASGSCFATDPGLVACLGRSGLERELAAGRWPETGLAFRLVPSGRWLMWHYLLVGRKHLIQVNLRVLLMEEDRTHMLAPVSNANVALQAYLSDEIVLSRYLATGITAPEEVCQIVRLENAGGGRPQESHVGWSAGGGLGTERDQSVIFTDRKTTELPAQDMLIIYP